MAKKLEDIIRKKAERLQSVPDKLISAVEKAQLKTFKQILSTLTAMETDAAGNIILNQRNITQISIITEKLKTVLLKSEYTQAVESFAKEIITQAGLTNSYFTGEFGGAFSETKLFKEVLKTSVTNTLSLYSEGAIEQVLITPIKQTLFNAVTSGSTMSNMIDAVSDGMVGLKGEGLLLRYAKRISHDAFAVTDRSYTNIIGTALKVEWFKYVGGLLVDSRDFCEERNGKYYHKKEIEAWASKDWQGKRAGTNAETIFNFAGGYFCQHSILPVSITRVPRNVIERNIASGNYKEAA